MTAVYVQVNLYLYLDSLTQINLQLHFPDMFKLVTELLAAPTAVIGLLKWKLKSKPALGMTISGLIRSSKFINKTTNFWV